MARKSPQLEVCDFPRCGRPKHAYGLCVGHVYQRSAGIELHPIRKKKIPLGAVCTFEGCGRKQHSKGLCIGHVAQRRTGKALSPLKEKKIRDGGWQETPCKSEKYPDLNLIHEVMFDWIIDFFLYQGVMPSIEEVSVAMGCQETSQARDIVNRLFRLRYLTPHGSRKEGAIKAFGTKYKQPIMRVLFEKIYFGPMPRRLTAKQAMQIGSDLYYLGKELHRRQYRGNS